MSKVLAALVAIQGGLKAPKDQKTTNYRYRNIEDVNESVKPLAAENNCAVVYSDAFVVINTTLVCVSNCKLIGEDGELSAVGCAVVEVAPKFMSKEQASGAASSYARKYAACGLFAIDDSSNDPDGSPQGNAQGKKPEKPPVDPAKKARNDAVLELNKAIKEYCDAHNGDFAAMKAGVKKRSDYADTAEFYHRVAEEFKAEIK